MPSHETVTASPAAAPVRVRRLPRPPTRLHALSKKVATKVAALAVLTLGVWLGLCPDARAGDVLEPGSFWPPNVELTRASGMGGAHSAIVTGNDAIVLNPAGLSQTKRYHFQADGAFDSRFPGQGISLSIVDSSSSAAGTGMLFQRWGAGSPGGRGEGWLAGLGYSYFAGNFFFGGTTRYLRFQNGKLGEVHQFVQDFGLLLKTSELSWSLVTRNLSTTTTSLFPPTSTLGVAFGSDADYHLAVDYTTNFDDFNNLKHKLAAGGELFFDRTLVFRAGYTWDVSAHLGSVSAGLSLVTEKLGLHFAWRRRLSGPLDQYFEGGLTVYLE